MIKRSTILLIAAVITCALPACNRPAEKSGQAVTVAVSVFPVYDIARSICGDRAAVFYAVPAGADPHTFEPMPSIARSLGKASLFIGVEKKFDGWIERYLSPDAARRYLVSAPRGAPDRNPHVWLSVREAKEIAARVAQYMDEIDPDNGAHYRRSFSAYAEKLNLLDRDIRALFAGKRNRSFIQWHESWNYFAADYGLVIAGTVQREGSDRASVRSIKEIVERARRDRVKVIAVGLASEGEAARALAREIGGTVVVLDGIGNPGLNERSDYLKLMLYNAKTLAAALR